MLESIHDLSIPYANNLAAAVNVVLAFRLQSLIQQGLWKTSLLTDI